MIATRSDLGGSRRFSVGRDSTYNIANINRVGKELGIKAETGDPRGRIEPPLLVLEDLRVGFDGASGDDVLRRVSFEVRRGEVMALVGESGCGKTLTALAILGLLPADASSRGSIRLDGVGDLFSLDDRARREVRGRRVAMIFQEPMSALNPVLSLGFQIGENLRLRRGMSRRQALREARRLLELVAMPDADRRLRCYPHQLSGGQLQRAMIAMALASEPDLLLADEPTTALDVTVQAQVLQLLLDLRSRLGLTVMLITHDLGVVAQRCDRVVVMYAGQVVEQASVNELFENPAHPYTRALLNSVPRLSGERVSPQGIPGRVPAPGELTRGCAFHPRCSQAMDRCREQVPDLKAIRSASADRDEHSSRCFLTAPDSEGDLA